MPRSLQSLLRTVVVDVVGARSALDAFEKGFGNFAPLNSKTRDDVDSIVGDDDEGVIVDDDNETIEGFEAIVDGAVGPLRIACTARASCLRIQEK